jgi:DNA-directed RNA polymerase subunit H (RpoH/RPB5)
MSNENKQIEEFIIDKIFETLFEGFNEDGSLEDKGDDADFENNYAPGLILSRGYERYEIRDLGGETIITKEQLKEILKENKYFPKTKFFNIAIVCSNNNLIPESERELTILFLDLYKFGLGNKIKNIIYSILNIGEYDKIYQCINLKNNEGNYTINDNTEKLVIHFNDDLINNFNTLNRLKNDTIKAHNSYISESESENHPLTQYISYKKLMFNIRKHFLIPKFIKLLNNDDEKKMMKDYNLKYKSQLPKIYGLYTIDDGKIRPDPLCEFYGFHNNNIIQIVNRQDKISYRNISSNFNYLRLKLRYEFKEEVERHEDRLKYQILLGNLTGDEISNESNKPNETSGPEDDSNPITGIGAPAIQPSASIISEEIGVAAIQPSDNNPKFYLEDGQITSMEDMYHSYYLFGSDSEISSESDELDQLSK